MKFILILFSLVATNGGFTQTENKNTSGCLTSLKIMTAFTPNGDSVNATFHVNLPCTPEEYLINIYNETNSLIYSSTNPAFEWDGTDPNIYDSFYHTYTYIIYTTTAMIKETYEGKVMAFRN